MARPVHAEQLPLGEPSALADQVRVPMRDGVALATDVYLPDRSGAALPTVLIRLPYDKSAPFAFMEPIAERLMEDGFAVVVQDVRGKARSEGETLAFVHEVADGTDAIDWVVGQQWSDGRVGMFGDSYYGFTQWAAAAGAHPALRCIVPRVTSTEIGADWMHDGGVFCLYTMLEWAIGTWIDAPLYHADIDWSVRPLDAILPGLFGGRRSRSLDGWLAAGPSAEHWATGIYGGRDPLRARIPVLHSPGTHDVFRRGQIRDWAAMASGPAAACQHLVLDATDHFDDVHPGDDDPAPDFLEDPAEFARFLPRYLAPARAFLRRYLHEDRRAPVPPRVRAHISHGGWRELAAWPPRDAETRVLHLHRDGTLRAEPGSSAALRWAHDPHDLVPMAVADAWRPLLERVDESPLHRRPDVHAFRSESHDASCELLGPATLVAVAGADADRASLIATLLDLAPDGRAERIAEGACRIGREERRVSIDFGPLAHRIRPGHRIGVALAASMFPRYLPTLVARGDHWLAEPGPPIVHRVELGGGAGARLQLAVGG